MSTQLEYFKEYKTRMAAEIGVEKTEQVIQNSLFIVSAGTNDFVVNYFPLPIRRKNYTLPAYIDFCLELGQLFMQVRQFSTLNFFTPSPPFSFLSIVIPTYLPHRKYICFTRGKMLINSYPFPPYLFYSTPSFCSV